MLCCKQLNIKSVLLVHTTYHNLSHDDSLLGPLNSLQKQQTALHLACLGKHCTMAKLLIGSGASVLAKDYVSKDFLSFWTQGTESYIQCDKKSLNICVCPS